jgi:hypothetical protein
MYPDAIIQRRQVLYWRLLSTVFGLDEQGANFVQMASEVASEIDLPTALLDPSIGIDTLLQRYPELEADFTQPLIPTDVEDPNTLRRGLVFSKLILNTLGPNTCTSVVSAGQLAQWLKDQSYLQKTLGGSGSDAEEIKAALKTMEAEMIKRMALREVLQDNRLAAQLTPSMALVEQLLRDKANLSGIALANAKRLIQQFIDELAQVLRLQVAQAVAGKIDRSVPPKRVFRNLDLKRTLWKNLTNWNPAEGRLYVDQLYYRRTARKKLPTRLIIVVDQSGSMVDAMVQCTILASIFAGLPHVDVHLIAFDTRVLDLTPWVHDPFEVLLRTELGGGTLIHQALMQAAEKIVEPAQTALVLITDFYEGGSYQVLLDAIRTLKQSGVNFIPVGAVTSSGYFSVEQWFRSRLKDLGTPILTGSPVKLISELKKTIVL